ncbi:MAG: ferredoxin [Brevinematales bacterium]
MAVKIDQEACIGCGVCEGIYPDLFEMGSDGKAHVKNVSSYDSGLAQDAASQCPVNAISVD